MSRGRLAVAALVLALGSGMAAACDAPTIPGRDTADIYPFDLPVTPSTIMRWKVGRTIRVHVVDAATPDRTALLRAAFEAGAAAWNETALFAEYEIAPAADLADADVVLSFSDVLLPVSTADCLPAVAVAVTTFCIDDLGSPDAALHTFPIVGGQDPGHVRMIVLVLSSAAANAATANRLVAHELGHVIGIGKHSDDTRDLMYRTDQMTARPTNRDAATAQVLYHVRANVVID